MFRFVLLIGLALPLLAACAESADEPSATAEPEATEAAEPTEAEEADIDIPDDLEERLVRENADHYTFACVYSYDIAESGYADGQVQQGLPLPEVDSWAVGTLGIDAFGSGDPTYITFYDAEGAPTDATEFTRIDEAERVCLLPAQ